MVEIKPIPFHYIPFCKVKMTKMHSKRYCASDIISVISFDESATAAGSERGDKINFCESNDWFTQKGIICMRFIYGFALFSLSLSQVVCIELNWIISTPSLVPSYTVRVLLSSKIIENFLKITVNSLCVIKMRIETWTWTLTLH